jgi:hypothetical protein
MMQLTKKQQHSLQRLREAIALIERLAPMEQKRSARPRKQALESAHLALSLHGPRLDVEVPRLGTWYDAEQYLDHARRVARQLREMGLMTDDATVDSPTSSKD